jgi:hypothetical protein
MNTIKRVKILIILGLLANTLYITPLWAQRTQRTQGAQEQEQATMGKQIAALIDTAFVEALNDPLQPNEYFNINLDDNEDGNLQIKFADKGVELLRSMEDEDIKYAFVGLRDKLVATEPDIIDRYESLSFTDPNGVEFASSKISEQEGGRHKPFFTGYRPQFYFRTTDVTGSVTLPEGVEMVMPGLLEQSNSGIVPGPTGSSSSSATQKSQGSVSPSGVFQGK